MCRRPRPRLDLSLVALFLSRPQILNRIAEDHTDDGTGRCRACSRVARPGQPAPYPCAITAAADEARRRGPRRATPAQQPQTWPPPRAVDAPGRRHRPLR